MSRKVGRPREFDVVVEARMTERMADHLDRIGTVAGVSRSAVIRQLIQDSIDRAEGTYDPLPGGLSALERSTLAALGGVGRG